MVKDVYYGKTLRKSFARHDEILDMPDLLEIQKKSYQWFLDAGLREVFTRRWPPSRTMQGNLELCFIDYTMDEKPKYSVEECKARDATYAAPIKVRVRLRNKETERDQGAGDLHGRFPHHDARPAPSSSTARSASSSPRSSVPPACTMADTEDKAGNVTYATTVIPYRGAWLEYETDLNDVLLRAHRQEPQAAHHLPASVRWACKTDQEILDAVR